MARRREVPKRIALPDPKYKSTTVTRFINVLMIQGKKSIAEAIVYGAFDLIRERSNKDPLEVFNDALVNAKPLLQVKSRRVGGATYQIPMEVRHERRLALAMRWISAFARSRTELTMAERLANELMLAARHEGASVKKKDDTHRMADANKAFAHFRW